jgi:hypothetical protein
MDCPGSKPGLQGEKLVTNHLCYGTAFIEHILLHNISELYQYWILAIEHASIFLA